MSVLYLHFETDERAGRLAKLQRSGAHVVVAEPRWPGFFELAKREKPYAIAIDFSQAPSHALETADYIAKAKETRDVAIYLLRVPEDRVDGVTKRLPQAAIVTDQELADRVTDAEREAQERARQKKEAAATARKNARARVAGEKPAAAGKQAAPARPARPALVKPSARRRKRETRPEKKSSTSKRKKSASGRTASRPARKR